MNEEYGRMKWEKEQVMMPLECPFRSMAAAAMMAETGDRSTAKKKREETNRARQK